MLGESIEETWDATVRRARRMAAVRMALGFLLLAVGAGIANSNDDLAYFRQERACAADTTCAYEVPGYPYLASILVVTGVFLAWAGLPRLAHNPPMPDRAAIEAPLGLSQAVWERLPPQHRMHSHLRALAHNIRTMRLAVFSLLVCLILAGLLLTYVQHGGFEAVRTDLACEGECPGFFGSPPAQDLVLAILAGIATGVLLLKTIKRAVEPAAH